MIFLQVCLTSPKCFTNYEPRVQSPLSERIVGDTEQWTLDISFLDKAAVSKNQLLNRGTYVLLKKNKNKSNLVKEQTDVYRSFYIHIYDLVNQLIHVYGNLHVHLMCANLSTCFLFFTILMIFLFLHSTSHVCDQSII